MAQRSSITTTRVFPTIPFIKWWLPALFAQIVFLTLSYLPIFVSAPTLGFLRPLIFALLSGVVLASLQILVFIRYQYGVPLTAWFASTIVFSITQCTAIYVPGLWLAKVPGPSNPLINMALTAVESAVIVAIFAIPQAYCLKKVSIQPILWLLVIFASQLSFALVWVLSLWFPNYFLMFIARTFPNLITHFPGVGLLWGYLSQALLQSMIYAGCTVFVIRGRKLSSQRAT